MNKHTLEKFWPVAFYLFFIVSLAGCGHSSVPVPSDKATPQSGQHAELEDNEYARLFEMPDMLSVNVYLSTGSAGEGDYAQNMNLTFLRGRLIYPSSSNLFHLDEQNNIFCDCAEVRCKKYCPVNIATLESYSKPAPAVIDWLNTSEAFDPNHDSCYTFHHNISSYRHFLSVCVFRGQIVSYSIAASHYLERWVRTDLVSPEFCESDMGFSQWAMCYEQYGIISCDPDSLTDGPGGSEEDCYLGLVRMNKTQNIDNLRFCKKMNSEGRKHSCASAVFHSLPIEQKESLDCGDYSDAWKDECLLVRAETSNDSRFCDIIESNITKDECYSHLALMTDNFNLCKKCTDISHQEYCLWDFAFYKQNPAPCLIDHSHKASCLTRAGLSEQENNTVS